MAAHATQSKERIKAVLLEIFGASDDEEDDFKQHAVIEGSHHCPNVVSDAMQVKFLDTYCMQQSLTST